MYTRTPGRALKARAVNAMYTQPQQRQRRMIGTDHAASNIDMAAAAAAASPTAAAVAAGDSTTKSFASPTSSTKRQRAQLQPVQLCTLLPRASTFYFKSPTADPCPHLSSFHQGLDCQAKSQMSLHPTLVRAGPHPTPQPPTTTHQLTHLLVVFAISSSMPRWRHI